MKARIRPFRFKKFTREQDKFIKQNLHLTVNELAAKMNICKKSLRCHLYNRGIKVKMERHRFTKKEDEYILSNLSEPRSVLALMLDVSVHSIQHRIEYLYTKMKNKKIRA